jgi:tyrosinase
VRNSTAYPSKIALKPFYADTNGNFHTSVSVRDSTVFGYTYPELQSGNPEDVVAAVNTLYGDFGTPSTKRSLWGPGNRWKANDQNKAANPSSNDTDTAPREYLVNIKADKMAQNGSYSVRIFLGNFTPDSQAWSRDANLVGTHSVFSKQAPANAPRSPMPVTGVVTLNKSLQRSYLAGNISALSEDIVVPYLKQNLHWKVQKVSPHHHSIRAP